MSFPSQAPDEHATDNQPGNAQEPAAVEAAVDSSEQGYADFSHLSEFQRLACRFALRRLLDRRDGGYFDICDFDDLAKVLRLTDSIDPHERACLRFLHCVKWEVMGEPLASQTRSKCIELLRLAPLEFDTLLPDAPLKRARSWLGRIFS